MNKTLKWMSEVAGKRKLYIVLLTLIHGARSGTGVLYALLMRDVVDSAVGQDAVAFRENVVKLIGLVVVLIAVGAIVRHIHALAMCDMSNAFKQRLADNILRKDYASVSATHTAEWMNRLTNDADVVSSGVVELLPNMVGTVVRMASALIMIIAMDVWFAYVLVPGGIAMVLVAYAFRKILKRMHKEIQESDGRLRIFLQERISNLMVVKAYAAEERSSGEAAEKMADHKAARMRRNRFSNLASVGYASAMQGMYLIGIIYCAHGIMAGKVTYGTLTAIMQLIGQVQGPFANISGYLPRWYAMTASAERLMEIEGYRDDEPAFATPPDFEALGMQHACFTYHSGEQDAPIVLEDLSFEARKGEYVAFTGYSGCGKSTVLKLLMCMYPLDSGERYIRLPDREAPLTAAYRRLFAYVPQGNALMAGTIRDAVTFAAPASGDQDERRIRSALHIACADFVDDIDASLGEGGMGLSEGQMQRIAIARAIYSGAPILLLDEATSALDAETERQLLKNLRSLTDRTVFIVTHRPAALSICDVTMDFSQSGVTISRQ